MTQIPEDIMKAAWNAERAIARNQPKHGVLGGGVGFDYREQNAMTIARAIMAERERCAAILAARLPLYAENLAQTNAVRECRESILTP